MIDFSLTLSNAGLRGANRTRTVCLGGLHLGLLALGIAFSAAPALGASDLLQYSDFGQPDILLSAATIRQSGESQIAAISQNDDFSTTDRSVYPIGKGNIADILQNGGYNQAYVKQAGNLNRVRIDQNGNNNYVDVSQTGVANTLDVTQTGLANTLMSSQSGTGNSIYLTQAGGNLAKLTETGERNSISVRQIVGGPSVSINLVGSGLI